MLSEQVEKFEGCTLAFYESLSSTMDKARSCVETGVGDATVIVASHQTAGRGRLARTWISESGNVYMTYIATPHCSLAKAVELSFLSCLAVGDVIRQHLSPRYTLTYKWPNDLFLNGKKVGGILLETVLGEGGDLKAVLIGIGVNVNSCPDSVSLLYETTCLHQEGIELDRDNLIRAIASRLRLRLALWATTPFEVLREEWTAHAHKLGERISVGALEGIHRGIDGAGALQIETDDGILHVVTAGDVIFPTIP